MTPGSITARRSTAFRFLSSLPPTERARYLLRTTDRSVAEICLDVGFTSVGSFTTTFRRHVGVTPTDYRRANPSPSPVDLIPHCTVMAWARVPEDGAIREDPARVGR